VPSSQSNAIETALATQGLGKFVMLLRGLKEFSGLCSAVSQGAFRKQAPALLTTSAEIWRFHA
jgi:hypothetical protein